MDRSVALNILTKICVVVLLVSSLVACVVFVSMATTQANYRYLYEQGQLELEQTKAKNLYLGGDAESQKASAAASRKDIDRNSVLQKENDDLRSNQQEASREVVKLKRELTGQQASVAGLTRTNEALVKTINGLHKDLTAAREEAQKRHAVAVEFETLLKKSQARAELLEREMSVLKQRARRQKADYITVNEKLAVLEKRHGIVDAAESADPLLPAERITGTITAIKDNLASVNIGSSSGLKKGMKLIIYRGADFVGKLKLENVDVSEAAGILMDGNLLAPLKGDKVTTKLD